MAPARKPLGDVIVPPSNQIRSDIDMEHIPFVFMLEPVQYITIAKLKKGGYIRYRIGILGKNILLVNWETLAIVISLGY